MVKTIKANSSFHEVVRFSFFNHWSKSGVIDNKAKWFAKQLASDIAYIANQVVNQQTSKK